MNNKRKKTTHDDEKPYDEGSRQACESENEQGTTNGHDQDSDLPSKVTAKAIRIKNKKQTGEKKSKEAPTKLKHRCRRSVLETGPRHNEN